MLHFTSYYMKMKIESYSSDNALSEQVTEKSQGKGESLTNDDKFWRKEERIN